MDTASGEIYTFFDEVLCFSKRGYYAGGTVGSGERKIHIGTTSGDVRIKAR
ncbi:MAG: hypothetical protein K2K63_08840 [Acetatifactor sp.]|nr:hypothetical protein [Acetatifactor sp.]